MYSAKIVMRDIQANGGKGLAVSRTLESPCRSCYMHGTVMLRGPNPWFDQGSGCWNTSAPLIRVIGGPGFEPGLPRGKSGCPTVRPSPTFLMPIRGRHLFLCGKPGDGPSYLSSPRRRRLAVAGLSLFWSNNLLLERSLHSRFLAVAQQIKNRYITFSCS
jgi:hypothetical protein